MVLLWVLIVTFVVTFYFIPFSVARRHKHPQVLAIFMLNLFLGWTFLGWVVSLVWACTAVKPSSESVEA